MNTKTVKLPNTAPMTAYCISGALLEDVSLQVNRFLAYNGEDGICLVETKRDTLVNPPVWRTELWYSNDPQK